MLKPLSPGKKAVVYGAALTWLLLVSYGMLKAYQYEFKPGVPAQTATAVPPAGAPCQLIMFANPQCPCTRASLETLGEIITRLQPVTINVKVLFVLPAEQDLTALHTSANWKTATEFTGAELVPDIGGQIAATYGARTSGQVFMHNAKGELQFQGGITSSRGHQHDNPGRQAVIDIARGLAPRLHHTPVFGCQL